jgi:hypothetical protein
MNRSLWGFWKFREQVPASPKRRFHLGIDYGTSTSTIVFRDFGAPGGDNIVVVLRDGLFLIPSRVCMSATEFLFGNENKTAEECDIYEGIKMLVADEVSGDRKCYYGPRKELQDGFSAADLATLTVWFLISEGHRGIAAYLNRDMEGVSIGMTMSVPMSFFRDKNLRSSFLSIARRALLLDREEGPLRPALLIEKARRALEKHPAAAVPATREYEIRIRPADPYRLPPSVFPGNERQGMTGSLILRLTS